MATGKFDRSMDAVGSVDRLGNAVTHPLTGISPPLTPARGLRLAQVPLLLTKPVGGFASSARTTIVHVARREMVTLLADRFLDSSWIQLPVSPFRRDRFLAT